MCLGSDAIDNRREAVGEDRTGRAQVPVEVDSRIQR
jgi:hypothetical protein